MNLDQAVVLVTGASSGIGTATARAASQAGARVVLLARREDRLAQLAEELDGAIAVGCDVTDPAQVAAAVDTALSSFGRIDVLVNNAGQGLQASLDDIDPDDFRNLLELNLVAPLLTMQADLPTMRKQGAGSIINVSSGTTFSALPDSGACAASKASLIMLSAVARVELEAAGISVSTIYPFITDTDFIDAIKAGREAASQQVSGSGMTAHPPELVADKIIGWIQSGAEQDDLVPQQFGGSFAE